MLTNHAATFVVAAKRLSRIHEILRISIRPDTPVGPRERMLQEERELLAELDEIVPALEDAARLFDMPSVLEQLETIRGYRADEATPRERIAEEANQLLRRLHEVLKARWFYYLPFSHVGFYQNPRIFGDGFADSFPSAVFDSVEAARCLALGRSTACVLHLMRVLDGCFQKGLNPWLGIKPSPSWGGYIHAIKDLLKTKPAPRRLTSSRDRAFVIKTVEHIHGIKEAWRNPSTHEADQHYSDEDAAAIMVITKRFVQHISTRVREPRPRRR